MSRPASAGSNHVLTSSALSKPSLANIFLTNLRLLDLDRRHDWPQINVRTFAEKPAKEGQLGQKHRIKCVEWALYHLFQIWDGDETREKLQPFFPPLEPLQSLNLRAALYRSLNELKKNGILGRESILRKTMLDECKGEKFLEILVLFSTAVLRKVQVEIDRTDRNRHFSAAMKLATAPLLEPAQQCSLLPLSIAHRASLTSKLERRADIRSRCEKFNGLLEQKIHQLEDRLDGCRRAIEPAVDEAQEAAIHKQLNSTWPGHTKWPTTMLYGDENNIGDGPLKKSFTEIWTVVADGGSLTPEEVGTGLLASLEGRVREHRDRLKRWQTFHERITTTGVSPKTNHEASDKITPRGTFTFDQHQDLRISIDAQQVAIAEPFAGENAEFLERYGKIVTEMNRRLQSVSKSRRRGGAGWSTRGASKPAMPTIPQAPTLEGRLSTSPRPQQNDASSNRLFSNQRTSSPNGGFSPSTFFSPVKNVPPTKHSGNITPMSPPAADNSLTDIFGLDRVRITLTPPLTPDEFRAADRKNGASMVELAHEQDQEAEVAGHSSLNGLQASSTGIDNAPEKNPVLLSLADRTRMSMASAGQHTHAPTRNSAIAMAKALAEPELHRDESSERRATLLDRTRQSMARIPAPDATLKPRKSTTTAAITNTKKHSRRPSRQSLFPVNQFETPAKHHTEPALAPPPQPAPADDENPNQRRNATPTERLFSDDADMASVFKSRPKVKVSPVFTPAEGRISVEPLNADWQPHDTGPAAADDDDDDIWAELAGPGSPLGARMRRRGASLLSGGE